MLSLSHKSYLKNCKYNLFHRQFGLFLSKCKILTKQSCRQVSHEQKQQIKKVIPFLDMINTRRDQARKSILVQVQSTESFKELHSYCNSLGTVNQTFHYTTGAEQMNFIIIEFTRESNVTSVINNSLHLNKDQGFPVHSNFLWFKASNRKSRLKLHNCQLNKENGNKIPTSSEIREFLQTKNDISEQIEGLYNLTKLNEVATRLRFLTTRQIELSVAGMFPHAIAYPFGSSVNGFGKMGCDLDIVFQLTSECLAKEDSRLVFHCKAINSYERSVTQRHMEVMGDLLQLFLPGCTQIRKILQARVPIIKYYQQFTDVECDLSMSNMSGVFMSDLLYVFGLIDSRVRPLVFVVRKWAQEVGITNNSPGRWLSNFSLTLLVLAFLQKIGTSPLVLPSINTILKQSGTGYNSVSENESSFIQNIALSQYRSSNTDSLEKLLKQFFNFYSSFDFTTKAINLNEAITITKPEYNALYIVNPLERGLNVSKNVSQEELEKFKYELRNASWSLESQEKENSNWGILDILQTKKKVATNYFNFPKQERLMEVSKLFDEEKEKKSNYSKTSSENAINTVSYHKANSLIFNQFL
ncbi:hypothetical protein RN001_002233 [Aquatica leii]|uniref:Poly(A) RNA polymerase, mitochondrial n=1 Tax=Aquatica leii TaxID=1421715 RepID=A0AAN7SK12_9COLE|nr:hypothetical protein RN001_002233 [Aquatica leii]